MPIINVRNNKRRVISNKRENVIKILISQEKDNELILFGEDSEVAADNNFV